MWGVVFPSSLVPFFKRKKKMRPMNHTANRALMFTLIQVYCIAASLCNFICTYNGNRNRLYNANVKYSVNWITFVLNQPCLAFKCFKMTKFLVTPPTPDYVNHSLKRSCLGVNKFESYLYRKVSIYKTLNGFSSSGIFKLF